MPLKILVIDDDADNRLILKYILQNAGFVVEEAADGPTGLAVADRGGFSLIVLDVMLPKMDGWQVCRTLKADAKTKSIPVLALTGRDRAIDEMQGYESGVDQYLTKPINPEKFLKAVKEILKFST